MDGASLSATTPSNANTHHHSFPVVVYVYVTLSTRQTVDDSTPSASPNHLFLSFFNLMFFCIYTTRIKIPSAPSLSPQKSMQIYRLVVAILYTYSSQKEKKTKIQTPNLINLLAGLLFHCHQLPVHGEQRAAAHLLVEPPHVVEPHEQLHHRGLHLAAVRHVQRLQ
jgi:hypothetical protein